MRYNRYFTITIALLGISQACTSFRNTAEFDQYRADWNSYDEQMAQFDKTQQQCIAQNMERERADRKAKELEAQKKQARKAAFDANPIVVHNRQLHQAIENIDLKAPSTIRALFKALDATEIARVQLDADLAHRFHAKANHCYLAIGIQSHDIILPDGQWLTSDALGYQTFAIPFYQIVPLPKLSGICTTYEAELSYKLPQNNVDDQKAIYIMTWGKTSIPEWLQAQMTVNVDADICHPIRWLQLWTNPIPGTMYYYDNEPVLRTDYASNNAISELVDYTGKYYSQISPRELTSSVKKAVFPQGFEHVCSQRPIIRPSMAICNDNRSVSLACCMENAKTRTDARMTETEAQLHYCGGRQSDVNNNMLSASNQIRLHLRQLRQAETFDMTEMMKGFPGINSQP